MPSLDRAFGMRGAAIALGMAIVAGGVQGVIAHQVDYLVIKVMIAVFNTLVLIIAGAISARRTLWAALALGVVMGLCVFIARWGGWSLMQDGWPGLQAFLTTPPWQWPDYLAAHGISRFWIVEASSMLIPAIIGCYAGQERQS